MKTAERLHFKNIFIYITTHNICRFIYLLVRLVVIPYSSYTVFFTFSLHFPVVTCTDDPCTNTQNCLPDAVLGYKCECRSGLTGLDCNTGIDDVYGQYIYWLISIIFILSTLRIRFAFISIIIYCLITSSSVVLSKQLPYARSLTVHIDSSLFRFSFRTSELFFWEWWYSPFR